MYRLCVFTIMYSLLVQQAVFAVDPPVCNVFVRIGRSWTDFGRIAKKIQSAGEDYVGSQWGADQIKKYVPVGSVDKATQVVAEFAKGVNRKDGYATQSYSVIPLLSEILRAAPEAKKDAILDILKDKSINQEELSRILYWQYNRYGKYSAFPKRMAVSNSEQQVEHSLFQMKDKFSKEQRTKILSLFSDASNVEPKLYELVEARARAFSALEDFEKAPTAKTESDPGYLERYEKVTKAVLEYSTLTLKSNRLNNRQYAREQEIFLEELVTRMETVAMNHFKTHSRSWRTNRKVFAIDNDYWNVLQMWRYAKNSVFLD